MELEARYVCARLRAVEERLRAAAEELDRPRDPGEPSKAGEYHAGYARGLMESRAHLRRLRESLASLGGLG